MKVQRVLIGLVATPTRRKSRFERSHSNDTAFDCNWSFPRSLSWRDPSKQAWPMFFRTRADELPRMHVLALGDVASEVRQLVRELARIGIEKVAVAESPRDAIWKMRESSHPIDLIVADSTLQNGHALELLKAVRSGATAVRPDICFVIFSALSGRSDIQVAAQLDVHHYVMKPITADKLKAAIVRARARAVDIKDAQYASVLIPCTAGVCT